MRAGRLVDLCRGRAAPTTATPTCFFFSSAAATTPRPSSAAGRLPPASVRFAATKGTPRLELAESLCGGLQASTPPAPVARARPRTKVSIMIVQRFPCQLARARAATMRLFILVDEGHQWALPFPHNCVVGGRELFGLPQPIPETRSVAGQPVPLPGVWICTTGSELGLPVVVSGIVYIARTMGVAVDGSWRCGWHCRPGQSPSRCPSSSTTYRRCSTSCFFVFAGDEMAEIFEGTLVYAIRRRKDSAHFEICDDDDTHPDQPRPFGSRGWLCVCGRAEPDQRHRHMESAAKEGSTAVGEAMANSTN